jgi:hypothetical protein
MGIIPKQGKIIRSTDRQNDSPGERRDVRSTTPGCVAILVQVSN